MFSGFGSSCLIESPTLEVGLLLSDWLFFYAIDIASLSDSLHSLRRMAEAWSIPSNHRIRRTVSISDYSTAFFSFGVDVPNFLTFFLDSECPWSPYPFNVEIQSVRPSFPSAHFEYPTRDIWPLWASQSCDLPSSSLIFPVCLLGEFSFDLSDSSHLQSVDSYSPPAWLRVSADPTSRRPSVFLNRRRVLFCWFGFSAVLLTGFGSPSIWFLVFSSCGNWAVAAICSPAHASCQWRFLTGSRSRVIGKGFLMRRSSRMRYIAEKSDVLPFVPFPVTNPPTQSEGSLDTWQLACNFQSFSSWRVISESPVGGVFLLNHQSSVRPTFDVFEIVPLHVQAVPCWRWR